MLSSTRIATFLVLFCVVVPFVTSDRLFLTEGGYARVVSLQEYPLSSFTVSSWVNVTRFSEGIAPIITYLSEDVTSQLAFFLRPEGVGVLWGGPSGPLATEGEGELPLVDRHPRSRWVEKREERRRKREAVDYSGGLGDIENILTKRSGKASNTWAPLNFVDVGEMGVSDLMLSGSEPVKSVTTNGESHPHTRVYSDWTNVPYELHMEESGRGIEEYVFPGDGEAVPRQQEPTIITKPSGNDDFVYFNWNVPSGRDPVNIPLGNNNWSPVWESTKQNAYVNKVQNPVEEGQMPANAIVTPPKRKQIWGSTQEPHQHTDVPSKWDAASLNADIYEPRPFQTKLLPTKVERPIWPSGSTVPQRHRSPARVPNISTPQDNIRTRYKPEVPPSVSNNLDITRLRGAQGKESSPVVVVVPSPPSPPSTPDALPEITTIPLTTTKTATTTTTTTTTATSTSLEPTTADTTTRRPTLPPRRNIIPTLYRYTKNRKNGLTTIEPQQVKEPEIRKSMSAVVPLWKMIKKTQKEGDPQQPLPTESHLNSPVYSVPAYTKPAPYTTTERSSLKTIKYSFPEPTLPPIKPSEADEPLQAVGSVRRNIYYRSRPVQIPSIARRPSIATAHTTSTAPPTTARRIPYRPTSITQKVPNYQSYKSETSTVLAKPPFDGPRESPNERYKFDTKQFSGKQTISGFQHNKYAYKKANEFEKAMQDPQLVKDGNTAVVYAVPITNEKEFYEMYKKYQRDSIKPSTSAMNLHDLYNEMRTGGIGSQRESEEENDANGIKAPNISLYESDDYPTNTKYSIIGLNVARATSSTTEIPVIREDITTSSTRSDVPVVDYSQKKNDIPATGDDYPIPPIENASHDDVFDIYDDDHRISNTEESVYDYYNVGEEQESADETVLPVQNETQTTSSGSDDIASSQLEDRVALADLYRPKETAASINTSETAPAHYQEQQTLYLDQLPPQYKKPEKQYDFKKIPSKDIPGDIPGGTIPTSPTPVLDEQFSPRPIYSSDPLDLLSQGLIPKPIHVVGSQAEAEEWMRQHHNVDRSPFFLSEGQDSGSVVIPPQSLPSPLPPADQQPVPLDEITQVANSGTLDSPKLPLDIHFEKAAYPFKENAWYHLTLTWNARTKQATIYVNGERIGIIENVLQGVPHLKEGGLFLLGKTLLPDLSDFDESSQFVGEISDLNMWATELSPLTVDALFQCKYDPVSPKPIDWQNTELKLYDHAAMTPSPPLCGLIT